MKVQLCLVISSSLLAAVPVSAKQQEAPLIVTGERVTFQQWSKRMNKALDARLAYPRYLTGFEPREGIVRVSFLCSDSGRPTAVKLSNSSGYQEIDAAALRAVSGIATMHPLPSGLGPTQRYQAVLLFAKSQESYDRQIGAFRRDAERRNAMFGSPAAQVAMGVGLMPAG